MGKTRPPLSRRHVSERYDRQAGRPSFSVCPNRDLVHCRVKPILLRQMSLQEPRKIRLQVNFSNRLGKQNGLVDVISSLRTATLSPIDIGDVLPSYILKNEKDEDVDVASLAAEKGVVFFLVPKADTRKSHLLEENALV